MTDCLVMYKCTTLYDSSLDGGVNPLQCGIDWKLDREPLISDKDKRLPSLVDYQRALP